MRGSRRVWGGWWDASDASLQSSSNFAHGNKGPKRKAGKYSKHPFSGKGTILGWKSSPRNFRYLKWRYERTWFFLLKWCNHWMSEPSTLSLCLGWLDLTLRGNSHIFHHRLMVFPLQFGEKFAPNCKSWRNLTSRDSSNLNQTSKEELVEFWKIPQTINPIQKKAG